MERQLWRLHCTARRTNGDPCGQWAITGGYVCWHHGGAAKQVRAAAARRWERELRIRRMLREWEQEHGEPMPPMAVAFIRFGLGDMATWRLHRATESA